MIIGVIVESLGPHFTDAVYKTASVTANIAIIGIPIFILVEAGISTIRFLFGSENGSFVNFDKMFTYLLIWMSVTFYKPIMASFDLIIDSITQTIRANEIPYTKVIENSVGLKYNSNLQSFKNATAKYNAKKLDILNSNETDAQKDADLLALQTLQTEENLKNTSSAAGDAAIGISDVLSFDLIAIINNAIARSLTLIVRTAVEILGALIVAILIVLGPLAMFFATMPWIGDGILKNWFTGWLSIKCWGITMAVIDLIMDQYMLSYSNQTVTNGSEIISSFLGGSTYNLVINICFIILFIMTPAITNYYVRGTGGQLFSKMIAGATTMVSSATTVASMGGSTVAQKAMQSTMSTFSQGVNGLSKQLDSLKKDLATRKN